MSSLGIFGGSESRPPKQRGGGVPGGVGITLAERSRELASSNTLEGNPISEEQTNVTNLRVNFNKDSYQNANTKLGINTGGDSVSTTNGHLEIQGQVNAPSANTACSICFRQTRASLAALVADDLIGLLKFVGSDGVVSNNPSVRIQVEVDATPSSGLVPGRLLFMTIASGVEPVERMRIDRNGNVIVNTAALATTATDGFLYIPTCAGTPIGTPTAYSGRVPMVYDTTNNKLYIYNGAWKSAAFA